MTVTEREKTYIVVDAGYGSESNYCYLEDQLPQHIRLIP